MSETKRNQQNFEELSRKAYDKVRRQAMFFCRNRAEAEDVTQEAFLRAFRHFDKCVDTKTFENWVLKIAKNVFLDLQRYKGRRVQTSPLMTDAMNEDYDSHLMDESPNPEDTYMSAQIDPELIAALDLLPEQQRAMLWLLTVEQADYAEIAARFGIPVGSVKSRIFRACQRLRNTYLPHFLAKRGMTPA